MALINYASECIMYHFLASYYTSADCYQLISTYGLDVIKVSCMYNTNDSKTISTYDNA